MDMNTLPRDEDVPVANLDRTESTAVRIERMDCPTEEALIRKRLASEPAVLDVRFDLLARLLTVTHLAGARPSLLAALDDIDMGGEVVEPAGRPKPAHAPEPARGWMTDNARLLAGGAAAVGAEFVAFAVGDTAWPAVPCSCTRHCLRRCHRCPIGRPACIAAPIVGSRSGRHVHHRHRAAPLALLPLPLLVEARRPAATHCCPGPPTV